MSGIVDFTKGIFTSLAQYGTNMIPSANLALLRGSGRYNPGPNYDQSVYRGPAQSQAYLVSKLQNYKDTASEVYEESGLYPQTGAALTEFDRANQNNKKEFVVGSSYFHPEELGSWSISDFKGSRGKSRFEIFAINSMNLVPSPLLNFFFSEENVEHLQNSMISEVERIRGIKIKPQSTDELLIIMRNKYLYAIQGNLPLSAETKTLAGPTGTPSGFPDPKSAYWDLPASSEAGMSLNFQLSQLNQAVLEECVKQILSNISGYQQYYKDASSLPLPLSLPVLTTMKGANTLQENLGFFSSHEINKDLSSFNMRYNII